MKNILITLLLICGFCINCHAEVVKMRATSASYKYKDSYGIWGEWSDWSDCNILVVINTDKDKITIYSRKIQDYDIIDMDSEIHYDDQGGKSTSFVCINEDGNRCQIRLRKLSDGDWQLYVDFDVAIVAYSLESNN